MYAGGLMQADGDEQTLFIGLSYVVIQKALDFFASDLFLQQVASSFRRAIQVPAFVNGSRVYASRYGSFLMISYVSFSLFLIRFSFPSSFSPCTFACNDLS